MSNTEDKIECRESEEAGTCEEARNEALDGLEAQNKIDQEARKADQSMRRPSFELVWSSEGSEHVDAQWEVTESDARIARDNWNRMVAVAYPDRVTYEFEYETSRGERERDLIRWEGENLELKRVRVFDQKTGEYQQWVKEKPNVWRAYDGDKPTAVILDGDWKVDEAGVVRMGGEKRHAPLPS